MKKILVISDTHGNNEWINLKFNYDYVIHAGDHLNNHSFMIKNCDYFVDGNNDLGNKFIEKFEICNFKFILVHGDEQGIRNYKHEDWTNPFINNEKFKDGDIIIFGHTHIPVIKYLNKQIIINPGSYSKPRLGMEKSFCEILIDKNDIKIQIIRF